MDKEGSDPSRRGELYRQREALALEFLAKANAAQERGQIDQAESHYKAVLQVDPGNSRALAGVRALEAERRHQQRVYEAGVDLRNGQIDAAEAKVRAVLTENPDHTSARAAMRRISEQKLRVQNSAALHARYRKPVSLEFRDATLKAMFELLSKTSGINFIFDKDVRTDTKTTVSVKNTTIEDALKLLLVTNQLEQKVLNENTILIYPNVPNKLKDYQDLVVKSFYLANADVKQTLNLIRTVIKTKDVYVDEKLNLLVMRDTPEAIRFAENLIAAQDLAESEVVLEMEVLEVSTSRLSRLGVRYPERLSASLTGAEGKPGTLTLDEFKHPSSGLVDISITNPALAINLKKTDADTNLLANPKIRVKNREKAKIHIGERVPVITTISTANVGVSESVNYLDVGLKLELEPAISLAEEVEMKVGLEVSSILETITRPSGTQTYRVGTRNAATTLRLKDGETQILAGLIQDSDRKSADKVPLLGDIPLLGRLFSSRDTDKVKTEIVLLMTPHIVRTLARPEAEIVEFFSGTESDMGSAPLGLRPAESPAPSPAPAPVPIDSKAPLAKPTAAQP